MNGSGRGGLNEVERAASDLGISTFNAVRDSLGQPPLGENDYFVEAAPAYGTVPTFDLRKDGVAPFQSVFYTTVDVPFGPYSEFLLVPVGHGQTASLEAVFRNVLTYSATVSHGRSWVKLQLIDPDGKPWRTLRVSGAGFGLRPVTYDPFVSA